MTTARLEEGAMLNGRYRITRALGKGGMGTVYLAEHVRLDAVVAVKEIPGPTGDVGEDRQELDRCEHEARFLVRLNHPNLPKVTDAFIENDRFYLVMEYIEGVTLEVKLSDAGKPLDVAQVIEWGLQIADVLSYLHNQEPAIIFRDLKPSNVMVQPDGNIRLIDFGIARRFHPGANKDTALLGSVGYSPPEQFGRQQTDGRSDIYAFGVTLHHLLTGRDPAAQPFKFPSVRTLNPAVPESLSRLIDSCVAMEPDARPATIEAVARALLVIRDEISVSPVGEQVLAQLQQERVGTPAVAGSASPRIISSKLQQVEAQKRRTGEVNVGGRFRRAAVTVTAIMAALAAVGGGFAYIKRRPHVVKSHPLPPALQTIPQPVRQEMHDGSVAPSDDNRHDIAPPPEERSVVAVTPGQVTVEQDAYLLPVTVHCDIRGHAGSMATVAVFFYDVNGRPLIAADRNSKYANQDGHLSIASALQVTTDDQSFEPVLQVPVREFPPNALDSPIKLRSVVVVDGQSLYSDMVDLTTPLPPDDAPDPNSSADGPASGTSTPQSGSGAGSH